MASTTNDQEPLDFVAGHCACTAVAYVLNLSPEEQDQDQAGPSSSINQNSRKPAGLTLAAACHCSKCQRLNGAPFVWTTHWKEDSVKWFPPPRQRRVRGADRESLEMEKLNLQGEEQSKHQAETSDGVEDDDENQGEFLWEYQSRKEERCRVNS